jgi:hypothetical protein
MRIRVSKGQRHSPGWRRVANGSAVLACAALLAALAGCGSSASPGTNADPASVVTASAPLYVSAVVRPDGALKKSATVAARTLTHQANVYSHLVGILQPPGSPPLDYSHDIAPWLGTRAGIFLTSLGSSEKSETSQLQQLLTQVLQGGSSSTEEFPFGTEVGAGAQGAIVLDTSDVAKARSFLDTESHHTGAHASTYRGVAYQATPGGVAFGIVDRFAVIGSVTGLHSVIDTSLGGPSLAHASGYNRLLAKAPSSTLAHVFANLGSSSGTGGPSGLLALLAGSRETNISLVPSSTSLSLDIDTLTSDTPSGGLLSSSSQGARALGELPGESWLAVGLGNVGSTLGEDIDALQGLLSLDSQSTGSSSEGQTGLSVNGLLGGILAPLRALGSNSAETKRDFASWMGSAGLFASGAGLLELKGGIVIESKDPARSRAAVAKLAAKLRQSGGSVQSTSIPGTEAAVAAHLTGLPVVLDIVDGRDGSGHAKFVIGIGEQSVEAALHPTATMSGSAALGTSAAALGQGIQPSLIVEFPTLLGLLEGVGLTEDPSISKFLPYLRSASTLTGGGESLGGGIDRFRLVLGLGQAG